jgi:magnesium transporter
VAQAQEDQETVAKKMIHYHQMTVPVVGDQNIFLGIIPSDTLVEVLEKEASEDVYRISAMAALTNSYFDTPFFRLLWERGAILIALLLAQTFSTMIIDHYQANLCGFLMFFITMLISTGGNSSSQTSALVIQGMASGEINRSNIQRFFSRELRMAGMLSLTLGIVSFIRVYLTYHNFWGSVVVSLSLALIVLFSVVLGSGIPILLKRLRLDPAFAAGPFLATLMDILGLLIYCYISSLFLPI